MYACIDLGSNSFHLLIGEWHEGEIRLIERCSEKVQLGEGVEESGRISAAAFERGLECLRHFQALISRHGVTRYWALGTNTFRVAENADAFVRAAAGLGIEISTISGVQEAVLVYTGVLSGLPDSDDVRLVIDIGGGSTEVIVGRGHTRLITHSLPIGCVAWRDRYFNAAKPACLVEALNLATTEARAVFSSISPAVSHYTWRNAFASSGTAKLLATVLQGLGLGAGEITRQALESARPLMLGAIAGGMPLIGLNDKRRDLLLPGLAVMAGLMESLGCESITFSPTALREGMLDFMARNGEAARLLDPRRLPGITVAQS